MNEPSAARMLDVWVPHGTPEPVLQQLRPLATIRVVPPDDQLPESLGHADLLVAGHGGRALRAIPRLDGLRVVQSLSAGVDRLVGQMPEGVTLCDAQGVHDVSVSEWTVMAILAARRNLPGHVLAQSRREWRETDARAGGDDLEGAEVLILGHGSIGRALEARLAPFGARITRVARRAREGIHGTDALPELLPAADVVVILLPLTDATHRFVDADLLARMHDGALLVNASRGGVVDTDALVAAVGSGRIRAALDVTDPEPLPADHPLWTLPGVLITPHVAGTVAKEDARAWRLVAEQVRRMAAGAPLVNVVAGDY